MSSESGVGGIPALTDAEREALRAQLESWFGDPRQAFLVSEIAPVVARIKADAVAAALAPVERVLSGPKTCAACRAASALRWPRAGEASAVADDALTDAVAERLRTAMPEVAGIYDLTDEEERALAEQVAQVVREHTAAQVAAAKAEAPACIDAAHLAGQRAWSEATFGPGTRLRGVLDHIRKELDEIEADPADVTEWVDVVILALDGAWRAGWEPQQIIDAIKAKQARNEAREWPDWRTQSPDRAIEHVRAERLDAEPAPDGGERVRETPTKSSGEVVDLLAALLRSVDAAKAARRKQGGEGRG